MSEMDALEAVMEHHTDMLMVEELRCDPKFSVWFAARCGVAPGPVTFVRNSVWDATRESDVFVQFGAADGAIVLVENKVTAPLSLDQANGYHQRGATLVSEERTSAYRTCLIAPSAWFAVHSQEQFDVGITYEEIADAIERDGNARARWRASVFRQGARRAKRKLTYSNEQTAFFLRSYYAIAKEAYPELRTDQNTGLKSLIVVYPLGLGKTLQLSSVNTTRAGGLCPTFMMMVGSRVATCSDRASSSSWPTWRPARSM